MPEVFGQHEISQTARLFSSILENISMGFSRMPFLEKKSKVSPSCPKICPNMKNPSQGNSSK
jgi:hypothetical protein